jgi:SAM-dependent methyltransferase
MLTSPEAQSPPVREAVNNLIAEIEIDNLVAASASEFAALKDKRDLKVHLGAGPDIRSGWVNIDLQLRAAPSVINRENGTVFINYDLRRSLPLENDSCQLVYSSHFFEHLDYQHGVALMRECHRVLKPGGVFRISLPNFRGLFQAYLAGDDDYVGLIDICAELPQLEPGTELLVDHVNFGVYQNGEHKWIYDEDKVVLLLKRLGYRSASQTSFQAGIDPDDPIRRKYSFYVEAVK